MLKDFKTALHPSLLRQIESYSEMAWYKTYRGQSTILLVLSSMLVIFASLLKRNPDQFLVTVVGQFLTFLPLSYFIYKGKKWAIVATQVLWTFSFVREVAVFLNASYPITSAHVKVLGVAILVYYFVMRLFVLTFKVERIRGKNYLSTGASQGIGQNPINKSVEHKTNIGVPSKSIGRVFFGLLLAAIGGSLFYWYELRPSRIKHECSWAEYKVDARPADPGVTKEEEYISKEKFESCASEYQEKMSSLRGNTWEYINLRSARDSACGEQLFYREPTSASPERMDIREASEEEYQFCLRDKGL